MTAFEVLNQLNSSSERGFQLTKRNGILNSTWLIYLEEDFYYYFDIVESIIFNEKHKYSEDEFLKEFENSYFEIDCECG